MLHIGVTNQLQALRKTSVGVFLGNEEGDEVLLPHKYVPETLQVGEQIEVFIYRDSLQRLIATTLIPKIELFGFAYLSVKSVSEVGAFLDWGLEKDLFVPFAEQARKMQAGKSYVVYAYLDEKTDRMVASSKLHRFFETQKVFLTEGEEVNLLVYDQTELGYLVVIDNLYKGLIYRNEVFSPLHIGDTTRGYVKLIRPDNKIDVTLQQQGYQSIEPNAQLILDKLKTAKGILPLNDDSSPEEISALLGLSKKAFKKAVGNLLRKDLISQSEKGIQLRA